MIFRIVQAKPAPVLVLHNFEIFPNPYDHLMYKKSFLYLWELIFNQQIELKARQIQQEGRKGQKGKERVAVVYTKA